MDISTNNSVNSSVSLWDQLASQNLNPQPQEASTSQEDSVRISNFSQATVILKDEEVDAVLQETVSSIKSDPHSAMFVHSGLDASRVAALIA